MNIFYACITQNNTQHQPGCAALLWHGAAHASLLCSPNVGVCIFNFKNPKSKHNKRYFKQLLYFSQSFSFIIKLHFLQRRLRIVQKKHSARSFTFLVGRHYTDQMRQLQIHLRANLGKVAILLTNLWTWKWVRPEESCWAPEFGLLPHQWIMQWLIESKWCQD